MKENFITISLFIFLGGKNMPAFKDLTGQRFGKLLVQYRLSEKKNNKIVWHCRCDCGKEKDIVGTQLTKTTSPTRSCGCLQQEKTREANQSKDLSGIQYGYLTVIEREKNGSKWICQCICGNTCIVSTNHLNSGHTQSCGCFQKEQASKASFINLTGNKYGLLTVLGLDTEKSTPKSKFYKCSCQCGNTCSIKGINLSSGSTQSCGCSRLSHGEIKISQLLSEYNIPFEREKTFDTCINPNTNKKLRFDFFVNNQYLIEYDGIQHFEEGRGTFAKDKENLKKRDEIKNQWCKKNNIPLIRIPYTKYNTLTIDDLLLS